MGQIAKRTVEKWSIDRLIPYELNAKKHPPEQVAKIAASIRQMGFNPGNAISVDKDGVVINGHGRRLAALSLGMTEVPVVVCSDLSEEQIRAYRLADNKVSEGDYDTELMSLELSSLVNDFDFDMTEFFDDRELDFATEDLGGMDLGALTQDLAGEVEQHSESTQNSIDGEDDRTIALTKVIGFSQVTTTQARTLTRLLAFVEGETGLLGAAAMCTYASEHMGV